jgi:hypothetical protein
MVNANSKYTANDGPLCDHYLVFSLDNMYVCAGEVEIEENEAMLLRSNLATFPPEIQAVVETQYGEHYDSSQLVLLTIVSHSKEDENSYPNVSECVATYCSDGEQDGFTSITIYVT